MTVGAAIDFISEAFTLPAGQPMGRQSAGASFLEGFVRHSGLEGFSAHVPNEDEALAFAERVRAISPLAQVSTSLPMDMKGALDEGTLFSFHPEIVAHAYRRRAHGETAYSVCGLTHTMASHRALDAVADMLMAPIYPWDALICTSRSIRSVLESVMDAQAAYIQWRTGAEHVERPVLPVIPLGINAADFVAPAGSRAMWRERIGLSATEVAIIYVGRLSVHAKANPLPMFLALEQAAITTGRRIHFVMVGWFANENQANIFKRGCLELAPSIGLTIVNGADPLARSGAWAAADIFFQLADNVQESFGLAPVEAMAAGLPVVVSDWDGFRDTVEHGVQGFRIPTFQAAPGWGADLASRYDSGLDNYDLHVGATSQFAGASIGAACQALIDLIQNPQLRAAMGQAGRIRVRDHFDWSAVIPQYLALWTELAAVRLSQPRSTAQFARSGQAAHDDPFTTFRSFPSDVVDLDSVIQLRIADLAAAHIQNLFNQPGAKIVPALLVSDQEALELLSQLRHGPSTIAKLTERLDSDRRMLACRSLVWMAKLGIVEFFNLGRQVEVIAPRSRVI